MTSTSRTWALASSEPTKVAVVPRPGWVHWSSEEIPFKNAKQWTWIPCSTFRVAGKLNFLCGLAPKALYPASENLTREYSLLIGRIDSKYGLCTIDDSFPCSDW